MNPDGVSMFRQADSMVVRCVATPETAVSITRGEIRMRWRSPWLWAMAAGVAGCTFLFISAKTAVRQYPSGRLVVWGDGLTAAIVAAVCYVAVLLLFGWFSIVEARQGSKQARRYTVPGATLQARYSTDAVEVTTVLGTTAYRFVDIRRIFVHEHTIGLKGPGIGVVLPRELVPEQALSYLRRKVVES